MDRRLRNRILLYLLLAGVLAYVGLELSGRKPVPKVAVVEPTRENLVSSISSNGKVEPIAPYVMRAQLDTFVEKVRATEGKPSRKGKSSWNWMSRMWRRGFPKRRASSYERRTICGPRKRAAERTMRPELRGIWQKHKRSATGCKRIMKCCGG